MTKRESTAITMKACNDIRLIDATALKNEIHELTDSYIEQGTDYPPYVVCNDIVSIVENAPSIDAVPLKHGKWIFGEFDGIGNLVKCSVCGFCRKSVDPKLWMAYPAHKFCGTCGAKMDGDKNAQQ